MKQRLRIAFVDDEPNILTALRRSMLAMLDEWEMSFFRSGVELLDRMSTEKFDIVVSDMRMPEMDGAALLNQVSHRHPETVRVILSGYADKESIFQTIGPAHIYLAKPCDPQMLLQAINSRVMLRDLMTGHEMRKLLGGMSSLPSAPALFSRLVAELRSPRASAAAVADIIGRDVAMTAELLKLTNSSYFAVNAKITSPLQAVRVLGLELVQTLALQIGIFHQFQGSAEMSKQIEALNDYSFALGSIAERLALDAGNPAEVAKASCCAALLSSIGSLILLKERTAEYRAMFAELAPGEPLIVAERRRFGAGHGLLGAYLLSLWGFADPIVEAVAFAAEPSRCLNRANPILTALHLAAAEGPSFPLLPASRPVTVHDTGYLAEVGQSRRANPGKSTVSTSSGGGDND